MEVAIVETKTVKDIFRLLLIIIISLDVGYCFIGDFSDLMQNEDVKDLLEWNEYGAILTEDSEFILLFVGLVFILSVIFIASFIGVFLFKKWARNMFLISNIIFLFFIPLFGISILLPWENFFYTVSSTLVGVTLVMMYLEPLTSKFENKIV